MGDFQGSFLLAQCYNHSDQRCGMQALVTAADYYREVQGCRKASKHMRERPHFISGSYQREALAKSSHFAHEDIQTNDGGKSTLVKFEARTRPKSSDSHSTASPMCHRANASHTSRSLHLPSDSPKPEPLPLPKSYSPDFSLTLKFGNGVSQNVMKSRLIWALS